MQKGIQRLFAKKAMKIRIEGPIDSKSEMKILPQLKAIQNKKVDSLIVIINSYGGSIQAAKNIAFSLQLIKNNQIPVYCFAEQFCLNSANLILTAGSECFANKLSVIGDIGFADDRYFIAKDKDPLIDLEYISNTHQSLDVFLGQHQLTKDSDCLKFIQESTKDLQQRILQNCQHKITDKQISPQDFKQSILHGGSVNPSDAQSLGFIDGVLSFNKFVKLRLPDHKVLENRDDYKYRAIHLLRNLLQVFKEE